MLVFNDLHDISRAAFQREPGARGVFTDAG